MNKSELITQISINADISKLDAERALNSLTSTVSEALSDGQDVILTGFGSFKVSKRAARTGRNPQTGETIQIASANVPGFKAGKALKDACNT